MQKILMGLTLAAILAVGCSKAVETHQGKGVVLELRSDGQVLVIDHQEMPGFMEAMTMPFEVKEPSVAAGIQPGDLIDFTLEKVDDWYKVVKVTKTGHRELKTEKKDAKEGMSHDHSGHDHSGHGH